MYIPTAKLYLKFDNFTISNSITSSLFEIGGDNNISLISNNDGYIMKYDQYLFKRRLSLGISGQMIIGFWLYPKNLGLVSSPDDVSVMEPIKMTLLSMTSLHREVEDVLSIYEYSSENNENYLRLTLGEGAYHASSQTYLADVWHYICVVYDGSVPLVRIYIDGSLQKLTSVSGNIPNVIPANIVDFYINRRVDGYYGYDTTYNQGYLDDMIILSEVLDYEEKIQRAINYSANYVVDANYTNIMEKNYGILFNDPSTIKVNSLIDDMSYVYIARNDGKILRGSPLFWESRRNFSNLNEEESFDEEVVGDLEDSESSFVNGFLNVKNSLIRF